MTGAVPYIIRRLEKADLGPALAIQATNYPLSLQEDLDAFTSRLDLAAAYCLAAEREGQLIGYLLGHGWASHAPPALNARLPADHPVEILFIHDLAVSAAAQGLGIGRDLVDRAFQLAVQDGLGQAELIAVQGAAPYWRARGFEERPASPALAAKVAQYGAGARWMTRDIPRLTEGRTAI